MSIETNHQRVTEQAHQLWDKAGRPQGRDLEFWLQAETEVLEARPLSPQNVTKAEAKSAPASNRGHVKVSKRSLNHRV